MNSKYARTRRNWGLALASIFFIVWLIATFFAVNELLNSIQESTDNQSVTVLVIATLFLLPLFVLAWVFYQDAQKMRAFIDPPTSNP